MRCSTIGVIDIVPVVVGVVSKIPFVFQSRAYGIGCEDGRGVCAHRAGDSESSYHWIGTESTIVIEGAGSAVVELYMYLEWYFGCGGGVCRYYQRGVGGELGGDRRAPGVCDGNVADWRCGNVARIVVDDDIAIAVTRNAEIEPVA